MPNTVAQLFNVGWRFASTKSVREHQFRLDAGFHATDTKAILAGLEGSDLQTRKISDLATVFGLSDFGLLRTPADAANGVPFYTVSDIQENDPTPTMFLAREYEPKWGIHFTQVATTCCGFHLTESCVNINDYDRQTL